MTTTKQLDETEKKIIQLTAQGVRQDIIAAQIYMSTATLCRRIKKLKELYQASTLAQLVAKATPSSD